MKILNDIIEECIELNALFTVYDIIPEAQARGCLLAIDKIAAHIKNYRYPIFYTRTIKELGCEIVVPIYHPTDKDTSEYDASDILPKSKVPNTNQKVDENYTAPIEEKTQHLLDIANKLYDMVDSMGDNIFSRKDVMKHLNVSEYKAVKYITQLKNEKVIEQVSGHNGSIMLYVLTTLEEESVKSNENQSYLFDKRGRYHVRVADVEKAGFEIGEKVSIMLNKQDDSIVVTNKKQNKILSQVGAVKVDIYKNVSISKLPFRHLNDTIPKNLIIKTKKREIKIIPEY